MTELELKVYDIVRRIPKGKVATYGQIAEAAGNRNLARVVGNIMHKNPAPFLALAGLETPEGRVSEGFLPVPCHRIVNGTGKMGANFGLGGPRVQAEMLRKEGVAVCPDKLQIENIEKYLHEQLTP